MTAPSSSLAISSCPVRFYGLDGASEWPSIRKRLPRVDGKRVVDLGCGFGWVSRWMREQGAASVLGIDLSSNMIGRARAATNDAAVEYRIADLETLTLPEAAFVLISTGFGLVGIDEFAPSVDQIAKTPSLAEELERPMMLLVSARR